MATHPSPTGRTDSGHGGVAPTPCLGMAPPSRPVITAARFGTDRAAFSHSYVTAFFSP